MKNRKPTRPKIFFIKNRKPTQPFSKNTRNKKNNFYLPVKIKNFPANYQPTIIFETFISLVFSDQKILKVKWLKKIY